MELLENEHIDILPQVGLSIIQRNLKGENKADKNFSFGIDAVLLSDFARTRKGDLVCDLGTGTGIIPILMSCKSEELHFKALEIQETSASMARRSVQMNNLGHVIEIVEGDIKDACSILKKNTFNVVTSNPPYMKAGTGEKNPDKELSIARHEVMCNLEDVMKAAGGLLMSDGHFYMIHRPQRLGEIFVLAPKYKMEVKRMRFVHPFADREPNMVLLDFVKCGASGLVVEKPLVVYEKPSVYTDEVKRIYKMNLI